MSQHTEPQVEALGPLDASNPGGTILPLLLENLGAPNPRARILAIRELSDYTDTVVIDRLIELADHDPDLQVRCAAMSGLGNFVYIGGISDYDLETDQELLDADDYLAEADFERVYDFLLSVYRDEKRTLDERRYVVESLSYYNNTAVEDLIAELYARPEKQSKISALAAMGYNGATRWEGTLQAEFSNPDLEIQLEAITAAGETGLPSLGKDLWRMTYADNRDVVLAAIWALGQTGWNGAFERLDELTLHTDESIRECADEAMDEWLFYNGLAQEHDQDATERFLDEE